MGQKYIIAPDFEDPTGTALTQTMFPYAQIGRRFIDEQDMIDTAIAELLANKVILKPGKPYWVVDYDDLPQTHFFPAWEIKLVAGQYRVVVNMNKARVIHRANIRRARNAELDRIDKTPEFRAAERKAMRGDWAGWEAFEIQKQVLRDLPATFDLARYATDIDLEAAWPSELSQRGQDAT